MTLQNTSESLPSRVSDAKNEISSPDSSIPTFETLDPLPETPYTTIAFNRAFISTENSSTIPLMRALAGKDDAQWWKEYIDLVQSGQLKRISRSQFTQIIRAFHPKYFFQNTGSHSKREFIERIDLVKSDMQTRGFILTPVEWGHILDCGRALKRPDQTQIWWKEMITSGMTPDIYCYNNYLASICGTAPNLQNERPPRFKIDEEGNVVSLGKSVSKSFHPIQRYPVLGMSKFATEVVQDMLSRSISPNAHTYEILMTAHARDNNVSAIDEIVQNIWGYYPDGTTTGKSTPSDHPGSPLEPSQHTLNVLANTYGYNGALTQAVTLITAISERYNLVIPVSAWLSLLLWTSRRSMIHKRPRLGFLSPRAAPTLFRIMTSPPYSVSPGIEAYWLIINHEMHRRAIGSVERLLVDALKRYGPNGTDLPAVNPQRMERQVLAGVKNWVPLLCEQTAKAGDKIRAKEIWTRWQERFETLDRTGLLRTWDEVEENRKSKVLGVVLPPSNSEPTSFSVRKKLARKTFSKRYSGKRQLRERWEVLSSQSMPESNVRDPDEAPLGIPAKAVKKSYGLWLRQARGVFGAPLQTSRRDIGRLRTAGKDAPSGELKGER